MSRQRSRRHRRPAPVLEAEPVLEPFTLDDLRHVRLGVYLADHSFFERARVHEAYARTVHVGRGVLIVAHQLFPRPAWRPYLAYFARGQADARFTLLPHAREHASADAAVKTSEALAAQMPTTSWQHSLGLFAQAVPRQPAA
ncbi:hypothetical protein [Streptomyces sp. NPDC059003]|uniref:hypothetical protein n=1 Tax=Streptomyces sp. NPDC059003 TaxID=3346691 RepID=UPI003695C46D